MSNFDKLKKYVGLDKGSKRFYSVKDVDISRAETELGFLFPVYLKEFYNKIGYGWFADSNDGEQTNLFIHPLDIVDLYQNTSEFSPPEGFIKGDLPIFDCGDFRFLVVRAKSCDPDRIYRDDGGNKALANNIEEFIGMLVDDSYFYTKN